MTDQDVPFMDETIVRLPADLRHDMAEHGRRDLFYFGKGVLGYRDMTVGCHMPLTTFINRHPARQKLILMPRGHFKTSVVTISGSLQKVVVSTDRRILIANETASNAQRFLSAIRQHVENNRVFRALYSDVIPKDYRKMPHWNTESLTFPRKWAGPEPTLDTIGMTGTMTSRHYTDIHVDDPISEEATKSDAVMQDVITRIDKLYSLMVKPKEDQFWLIGTRWALWDVYKFFLEKLGANMARFVRAAIVDGEPIFPELLDLETLAQIREIMGEYMFSCLYMNNPRDIAAQDFNVGDLEWWKWSADEEDVVLFKDGEASKVWPFHKLDVTTSVDLAVAEKVTDDRNAIVTTGVTPDGEVVVLESWAKRCTPLEVIEHLFWVKRRYGPRAIGIEGVAYQKAFKYFLKAECERRGEYMNIVELKALPSKRSTGNNSKETRIRGIQPIAASGRLYLMPTMHELRNEMADFPLGKHDDLIDALASQTQMWSGYVSPSSVRRRLEREKEVIREIHAERQGLSTEEVEIDELFNRYSEPQAVVIQ